MPTVKLSQIAPASSPPALTDQVVGVSSGVTDLLYSVSQLKTAIESGIVGGSNGELQYNASSVFGGMSGTSWDDTNRSLTMNGAVLTANHPVFELTQSWNNNAVVFTGLLLNVTNAASAPLPTPSKFFDFQVGSQSVFSAPVDGGWELFDGFEPIGVWYDSGGAGGGSMAFYRGYLISNGQRNVGMLVSQDNNNPTQVTILKGTGTNRFSIESDAALVHICANGDFEWESPNAGINFRGFIAASGAGQTINFTNNGETPTFAVPISFTATDNNLHIADWYQGASNVGFIDKNGAVNAPNIIFTGSSGGVFINGGGNFVTIGTSLINANSPVSVNGTVFTNDATFALRSKASMNDGSAGNLGTLGNAPAAGNPTKWVPYDDNGTTRFIPMW